MIPDSFFRKLTAQEEISFRQWARDNYVISSEINELWHPSVRDECNKMNKENNNE